MVEILNLNTVFVTSSIPTEIGLLSRLGKIFKLSTCVAHLIFLSNLAEILDLGFTNVNGIIPTEIGHMKSLRKLINLRVSHQNRELSNFNFTSHFLYHPEY